MEAATLKQKNLNHPFRSACPGLCPCRLPPLWENYFLEKQMKVIKKMGDHLTHLHSSVRIPGWVGQVFLGKVHPQAQLGFPGGASSKEPDCQCKRHETRVQPLGWEDPLKEGMAAHSSILAWRIPWTEEPGGLQSVGSQRVRHN